MSRRNKQPRMLTADERDRLEEFIDNISYSARSERDAFSSTKHREADNARRYNDDQYEYRHVQLPKPMLKAIPRDYFEQSTNTLKLLWEDEWRGLGITQVCSRASLGFIPAHPTNRASAGSTTKCMNQSLTFCFSSKSPVYSVIARVGLTSIRRPMNYQPPITQG